MYSLGFYLFEEYSSDRFLLTNDLGRYVFLRRNAFDAMINKTLTPESQEYLLLRDNGFIYEATDQDYIRKWQNC